MGGACSKKAAPKVEDPLLDDKETKETETTEQSPLQDDATKNPLNDTKAQEEAAKKEAEHAAKEEEHVRKEAEQQAALET